VIRFVALAIAAVLAFGGARVARADDEAAADRRRALVLLKVLSYDRQLAQRARDRVTILVVADDDKSAVERDRWLVALASVRKVKVGGRAIVTRTHAYTSSDAFDRAVKDIRPAAIVVCGGLGTRLGWIRKAARAYRAMTFTTRIAEVEAGFTVGLLAGDTKDEIAINVAAAQAEAVQFEAGLLRIARRVGGRK
jgi:hypothetical protein